MLCIFNVCLCSSRNVFPTIHDLEKFFPNLAYKYYPSLLCVKLLQLCPILSDRMDCIAHQAPLSMGFSRHEHWSGLPFPSPIFIIIIDYLMLPKFFLKLLYKQLDANSNKSQTIAQKKEEKNTKVVY